MNQIQAGKGYVLSVIIPVYNGEKYLERAVNSILNQPCGGKLEVIIIDDGSKDSSGLIADKIAEDNANVRVFHQKNAGVSSARNFGINNALGKYIAFLDSDDWWEPSFFDEIILNDFLENSIDIYQFSYKIIREDLNYCREMHAENCYRVFDQKEFWNYNWQPFCSYIYRKQFITDNGICFLNTNIAEDNVFALMIFYLAKNLKSTDKFIFSYWKNNESVTNSTNPIAKLEHAIYSYMEFDKWLNMYGKNYKAGILSLFLEYLPACVCYNKISYINKKFNQKPFFVIYTYEDYDLPDNVYKCIKTFIKYPYWFCIKHRTIAVLKNTLKFISFICPPFAKIYNKKLDFKKYNYPYKF